jgi:GT2 family glycosyltransferase
MIAFGCSVISPDTYNRFAGPGLERAREPDSPLFVHAAASSVARGCNLLFDRAAALPDLEALVIVHQDAEIIDPGICTKLRAAFADPAVGVVGCVGAVGVRDIAWWDGTVTWTSAPYRYGEQGGGELCWPREHSAAPRAPGEVESLYGVLMAFSPWVVRSLRFDESFGLLHGYDFDICAQVREAGRKVLAADIALAHHHSLDLVGNVEMWVEAHTRAA